MKRKKPSVNDVIEMLEQDMRVRSRALQQDWLNHNLTGIQEEAHVVEYIDWLIGHLEFWVENRREP